MASPLRVFMDIKELYTFRALAQRGGRRPQAADLKPSKNSAMVVSPQGQILWLGPQRLLDATLKRDFANRSVRRYSLKGKRVYPGLVEPHTHLVFSGDRSEEFEWRQTGVSYAEISRRGGGILSTVRSVKRASEEQLKELAEKRLRRLIRQGVSTVEVKTGYGLSASQELKLLGVIESLRGPRVVSCYLGGHALPKDYKGSPKDYIQKVALPTLRKIQRNFKCRRADIFVEDGFFDKAAAELFFEAATELGFTLTVHAEQLTRQGSTEMMIRHGGLSLDHGVHLSRADVKKLARSEVTCVALPAADFYLKCPFPPARGLLDEGGRVALATDYNPGTSPTLDLAFVGMLARLEMKMTLAEVWGAYTVSAAHALGLEKECGSLEVGKSADFLVSESGPSGFFYEVGFMPVEATYVKGKLLNA